MKKIEKFRGESLRASFLIRCRPMTRRAELKETMSREEALDIMWAAHVPPYEGRGFEFMYAELTEVVEFHEWNGNHPVDENTTVKIFLAGTKVLVTVYSRFGDVGIRARDLEKIEHGYDARVDPEILDNWRWAK